MKTFIDNLNRSWKIEISVWACEQVLNELQIDMLKFADNGDFGEWSSSPYNICNILYTLCKEQVDRANVSAEDFGKSLWGDAFDNANKALREALIDFFPLPKRLLLAKMQSKAEALTTKAMELMSSKIDSIEIEDVLRKNTPKDAGNSSTLPQAS